MGAAPERRHSAGPHGALRDTDEARLLDRLTTLLARFPVEVSPTSLTPASTPPAAQPTPDGWCVMHGVQMKQKRNDRGTWYSHKLADGAWCKGKGQGR